jgi:hypothetical protein
MNEIIISLDVSRIYDGVFKETPPEIPLELAIYFNNEKIFDFDKSLQQSNFCKELTNLSDNEPCSLRFVMNNKTYEHTKIDEEGNIIGDCRIAISNVTFDDIALGQLLIDNADYLHSKNASDGQIEKNKFYGEMGCNGTVELKFYTPIYLWLLENM